MNNLAKISFLVLLLATLASARIGKPPHRKLQLQEEGEGVPDQYIVQFSEDVSDVEGTVAGLKETLGDATVTFIYNSTIKGFAVKELFQDAIDELITKVEVESINQDAVVTTTEEVGNDAVENAAAWGLDRIDQRALPLDNLYHYKYTGKKVLAYIIDTGIYKANLQFKTRRSTCGFNALKAYEDCTDLYGHGTHVAGTIGGLDYGVAKDVMLIGVKVLNRYGSGTWADVIAGVDYVARQQLKDPSTKRVANMSLGGYYYAPVNAAVTAAIKTGVTFAVSAGNDNFPSCYKSPASTPEAITVGATDINDRRASFSNFGSCVDIFAPGVGIKSSWIGKNTATNTISGTSMASPHVAGVAALYLQAHPTWSPEKVWNAIRTCATTNVVQDPQGSPNLLLSTTCLL